MIRRSAMWIACSALVLLAVSDATAAEPENCTVCHRVAVAAPHARVACSTCHPGESLTVGNPAVAGNRAVGCVSCHRGHDAIFDHAMVRRTGEKQYVERNWAKMDSGFWDKNCTGCHVSGCLDCHGNGHAITRPTVAVCQSCHKGYYTGWDYSGRAPRESNMRYQRGMAVNGETFLKMLPDVHYRAGMACGACHSMSSLAQGKHSSKGCTDCHTPSTEIIEHRIGAHLTKMECAACHAAWASQEYGTFYLRFRDPALKEDFDLKPGPSSEYLTSVFLRKQDAPPLGINAAGRISPIRPQFMAYYTDIQSARNSGPENILLAAEWRTFLPHTIQRGTSTCEGCHDTPARFLLEPESQRVYQLKKDGMTLESFWDQAGQQAINGSFMTLSRYQAMRKGTAYTRAVVEKWREFLKHVEASSQP